MLWKCSSILCEVLPILKSKTLHSAACYLLNESGDCFVLTVVHKGEKWRVLLRDDMKNRMFLTLLTPLPCGRNQMIVIAFRPVCKLEIQRPSGPALFCISILGAHCSAPPPWSMLPSPLAWTWHKSVPPTPICALAHLPQPLLYTSNLTMYVPCSDPFMASHWPI